MKKHYYLILVSFINIFVSCNSDFKNSPDIVRNSNSIRNNNYKVLQERLTPLPRFKDRRGNKLRTLSSDAPDLTKSPYHKLGAMYIIGNGIIGHPDNIGDNGIIDIESMLKDKRSSKYLYNSSINSTSLNLSTYLNDYSHTEIHNEYDKIYTNAGLNLGFFKMTARASYEKIFNIKQHERNKVFFGKLDIIYKDQEVKIGKTEREQKDIAYKNLDDNFLYAMHMGSISDYLENKGFFVVSDFYTGGRLTALYCYKSKNSSLTKTDSTNFEAMLKASFAWGEPKEGDSSGFGASLKIGYVKKRVSFLTFDNKEDKYSCNVRVFGGDPSFQAPTNIENLNTQNPVDYGAWYKSLSNKSRHVIVDIGESGILPVSKFVLEENFKRFIDHYIAQYNDYIVRGSRIDFNDRYLIEPQIDIIPIKATDFDVPTAYLRLTTRRRERIHIIDNSVDSRLLKNIDEYGYEDDYFMSGAFEKESDSIFNEIKGIFKCKIGRSDKYIEYYNLDGDEIGGYENSYENYILRFDFNSENICKYKNPYSNIWYIYDKKNKTALSYYEDEENIGYIPELYGITDWVENLPVKQPSIVDFTNNYTIIAI